MKGELESDLAQYIIQSGLITSADDAQMRREILEGEGGTGLARELLTILGPYDRRFAEHRPSVNEEELRMYLVGWLGLLEFELKNRV